MFVLKSHNCLALDFSHCQAVMMFFVRRTRTEMRRLTSLSSANYGWLSGGRERSNLLIWFYKSATAQQLYTFNKQEEQEIREEFFKLDTDQSGFITKGEFFSNLNVWYSEMIESVCAQVESYSGLTWWRFIEKWYCGEVSSMLVLSLKVISWVSQTFQRRCWLFSLVVNTSMEIRCVNSRQQSNYNLELNQLYKISLDQWRWL